MLDIAGKPCLERVIEHIEQFGKFPIIVKVHHEYQQVMDYFGDRVFYYYQKELKNEDESLNDLARFLVDDYTLVVNGDTLTNVDISQMLALGNSGNVKYMDSKDMDKYAGTMLLSPNYWQGKQQFQKYYAPESYWLDIGSFDGLNRARKFFYEQSLK